MNFGSLVLQNEARVSNQDVQVFECIISKLDDPKTNNPPKADIPKILQTKYKLVMRMSTTLTLDSSIEFWIINHKTLNFDNVCIWNSNETRFGVIGIFLQLLMGPICWFLKIS